MKINDEIIDRLEDADVPVNDGLSYLLSVYFDCVASTVTNTLIKKIHLTKILGLNKDKELVWNTSLFQDREKELPWKWVIDEYREMFKRVNEKRAGPKKASVTRMKKFFSESPEVRKDEVLGATKLYIRNLTSPHYITSAHYFISKGRGSDRVSGLEDWVDKYKGMMFKSAKTTDVSKTMQ